MTAQKKYVHVGSGWKNLKAGVAGWKVTGALSAVKHTLMPFLCCLSPNCEGGMWPPPCCMALDKPLASLSLASSIWEMGCTF